MPGQFIQLLVMGFGSKWDLLDARTLILRGSPCQLLSARSPFAYLMMAAKKCLKLGPLGEETF